ncbi:hypothetical protein [Catenulispora rubra]|uniref:hypothetical protein n=1 Tax=Catenulispora rubra TaxID=280293 RepID=UPI00189276DE|nr:hypothetical protein [Catenulispora rubra]
MDPRRLEKIYDTVREELDGLDRFEIEQRACVARARWHAASTSPNANPEQRALAGARAAAIGRILIHLRRTWTDEYGAADHAARALAAERVDPEVAAGVRAAGHPVGARVEVVGEERTGVVQQILVSREEDGYYARWYVVHVAELQLCRAYGCDELETLEPEQAPLAPAAQHSAASFAALAERAERAERGSVTVRHGQRGGRRVLAAA